VLRRLQAFFVLWVCVMSAPAAAQEAADKPMSKDRQLPKANTGAPAEEGANPAAGATEPTESPRAAPPPTTEVKPAAPEGWHTEVTGYFRAPMALSISSRPGPDDLSGPSSTQVSFVPNRTLDASYYSFAYTRLQEQDWAEVFFHEKHKHVDAVVGWMGYWFQSVGFRNPDAAWVPGMAYLVLDTDFAPEIGRAPLKPNIALTTGAWWPKFGYFEKYDTYTLGRFRQIGGQLKFTIPLGPDFTLAGVHGLGTGRDGSFSATAPPLYATNTGLDLITWQNVQLTYKKYVDVGVHFNTQWTADPQLTTQNTPGDRSFAAAKQAHLTTLGAEASLTAPYAGRLWISPSYINVRNGWALANTGTEVMHSLGGLGIASNYMAWTGASTDSTGSGTMLNLGFLYENTLSGIQGRAPGSVLPEVTLNVFGLLANASLDLPAGSTTQKSLKQFKYGADVTVQALSWLAFMIRYDTVNYDLDHPAYIYAVITPRAVFSSHFLSGERIYLQYSRYIYGDKMVLSGKWPWGGPLVAGSDILQEGPYAGQKPDEDVVKLQAEIAF
jgi:hypothetical protein